MTNPTQDVFLVNESPVRSNDWIYIRRAPETEAEIIRYDQFVLRLAKAESRRDMIFHAILGLCGEVGELADVIKKELVYNKSLDRAHLVEELGDIRFYLRFVQNMYEISDAEVLQRNADKLSIRYKDLTYTDQAAQDRADKDE